MDTFVALFRGINVGGRNLLPMKALAVHLEACGARNIRTYIQSGNAVFQATKRDQTRFAEKLTTTIRERHRFEPYILILGLDELEKAIRKNPFPEAESDPKSLHLGFLASTPGKPDMARLDRLRATRERFHLGDRVFYLHAPDGIGKSKLANNAEKLLGVPMTDRNWRTVTKILEMAKSEQG